MSILDIDLSNKWDVDVAILFNAVACYVNKSPPVFAVACATCMVPMVEALNSALTSGFKEEILINYVIHLQAIFLFVVFEDLIRFLSVWLEINHLLCRDTRRATQYEQKNQET